jgi:TRAP-type C4-dicarboxylate transport system permease small subunit
LDRAEELVLSGSVLAIAGLTIANVGARAFWGRSIAATEELCSFLIVFLTFAGLGYAAGQARHIRMTALYERFSRRGRKFLATAICGLTAVLMFYLAYHALQYVLVVRKLGSVSPALQVPLYLVYLAAPLGFLLAALYYALGVWRNLLHPEIYLSVWVKETHAASADAHGSTHHG